MQFFFTFSEADYVMPVIQHLRTFQHGMHLAVVKSLPCWCREGFLCKNCISPNFAPNWWLGHSSSIVRRMNSYSTLGPVSTRMGDHLWAGISPRYVTRPTRSSLPCIGLRSLNRVLAFLGWGKGGNVTSARWEVTLCDHASSCSAEAYLQTALLRLLYC